MKSGIPENKTDSIMIGVPILTVITFVQSTPALVLAALIRIVMGKGWPSWQGALITLAAVAVLCATGCLAENAYLKRSSAWSRQTSDHDVPAERFRMWFRRACVLIWALGLYSA